MEAEYVSAHNDELAQREAMERSRTEGGLSE